MRNLHIDTISSQGDLAHVDADMQTVIASTMHGKNRCKMPMKDK